MSSIVAEIGFSAVIESVPFTEFRFRAGGRITGKRYGQLPAFTTTKYPRLEGDSICFLLGFSENFDYHRRAGVRAGPDTRRMLREIVNAIST
jgi:hypothetical protein